MSEPSKLVRLGLFATVTAGSLALVTAMADAQTKKRDRKPARDKVDASVTSTAAGDAGAANVPLVPKTESASPKGASPSANAGGSRDDGGVLESKTLDGGARVFRFGEMEIEGRLRNPQLVVFLRRVRAEFSATDLGHRSFMQELGETKKDPNF